MKYIVEQMRGAVGRGAAGGACGRRAALASQERGIPSHTYNGWFIGSGVETRLSGLFGIFGPGWFWHNEYRFADYHSTALSSGPLLTTVSVHPFVQTVRSELLYKFNWSQ